MPFAEAESRKDEEVKGIELIGIRTVQAMKILFK
jgi:hypothetical protein